MIIITLYSIIYIYNIKEVILINIKNEIKAAAMREGLTLTMAIEKMNKKYNKKQTLQNISNKLQNNTIKFNEVFELLDAIGYKIEIKRKNEK